MHGLSLFLFFLFLSGLALSLLPFYIYNSRQSEQNISRLTEQIDMLLDEAEHSATDALELSTGAAGKCPREVTNRLSIIAARYPHIRAVNLLHNGVIYCTSMPDNQDREVDTRQSVFPLYMREINSTPENPVISLTRSQGEMTVMVSVDTFFIRNAMNLALENKKWIFRINNQFFTSENNKIQTWDGKYNISRNIKSSLYNYNVSFKDHENSINLTFIQLNPGFLASLMLLMLISIPTSFILYKRKNNLGIRIRKAIHNGDIYPVYQPVVGSIDHEIRGYEVLSRWKTVDGKSISPDIFIPAAEENGLLIQMTKIIMLQAEKQFSLLQKHSGVEKIRLAFNFSYLCIMCDELVDYCLTFAFNAKKNNIQIVIEITEREKVEDVTPFIKNMNKLRNAGCQFAIDDFGTGYSGISLMFHFTPDYIKIDKLFISHIDEKCARRELTDSIIDMARAQGISVVAEGVETYSQVIYLESQGVDFLQGFYFYKPLSAQDMFKSISPS